MTGSPELLKDVAKLPMIIPLIITPKNERSLPAGMRVAVSVAALCLAALSASTTGVDAKGCLKGAIVGGVAGHYAGHHGFVGAVAGCLVGRHAAKVRQQQQQQQQNQDLAPRNQRSGAPQ